MTNVRNADMKWCTVHLCWESPEEWMACDDLYERGFRNVGGVPMKVFEPDESAESDLAQPNWKPISTAPKDGTDIIVGFDIATVWIVRSAWFRGPEVVDQQPEAFDATCIGWWSYYSSVSQEKLEGTHEPTHWLCEVGEVPWFQN